MIDDLHLKSSTNFINFKNSQDMFIAGKKYGYCDESPLDYECEAVNGQGHAWFVLIQILMWMFGLLCQFDDMAMKHMNFVGIF